MFEQTSLHFHTCVTMFGDAWILLVIAELLKKPQRFSELQRAIKDVSPATLSDRLKKLESYGLVERTKEEESKLAITYTLTERGRALEPVVSSISYYAEHHLQEN